MVVIMCSGATWCWSVKLLPPGSKPHMERAAVHIQCHVSVQCRREELSRPTSAPKNFLLCCRRCKQRWYGGVRYLTPSIRRRGHGVDAQSKDIHPPQERRRKECPQYASQLIWSDNSSLGYLILTFIIVLNIGLSPPFHEGYDTYWFEVTNSIHY